MPGVNIRRHLSNRIDAGLCLKSRVRDNGPGPALGVFIHMTIGSPAKLLPIRLFATDILFPIDTRQLPFHVADSSLERKRKPHTGNKSMLCRN